MTEYNKAIIPFVAGCVLVLIDKLAAGDSIPDWVWIPMFGAAAAVWAVPNKPKG